MDVQEKLIKGYTNVVMLEQAGFVLANSTFKVLAFMNMINHINKSNIVLTDKQQHNIDLLYNSMSYDSIFR